ncbi:putative ribonuclease H-like domain-containing protein [Tanacetum coccineum]
MTARLAILNLGDYDLWLMRIEQYFLKTDYSLWEVIKNGNKVLRRTVETVEQEYEPTTAEEKQDRRNEMKARATLLMALPNKDQLKFHSYQDAKLQIEAIEKRYGGNKESNKVQRTLLKQQYENFTALSSEIMDQTFDRLQKLIKDLEQLHPDDLEEMDLQWEMFMLTIRARRFIKRTGKKLDINRQRVGFDKSKVECFNYHKHGHFAREYGIRGYDWSYPAEEEQPTNHALMAFTSSGSSSSSDSEVDSCSKTCLESVEARLAHYKKNEVVFEESINVLKLEVRLRDNALNEYKMNLEKAEKERDQLKQTLEKFQNSSKSLNNILESQVIDKFKTGLGYDAATAASPAVESFVNLTDKSGSDKGYQSVPPPLSGNFIPRKPDLTFIDEIVESENLDVTTVVTPSNVKTVENKGVSNIVESNAIRMNNTSAPIIEDWNSDDERVTTVKTVNTTNTKAVKTVRSVNTAASKPIEISDILMNMKIMMVDLFPLVMVKEEFLNNVLFTDTECLVLSSNFKLLDESKVLLRVPRKDNIYSVDLKSVVPTGGLTCLIAKATIDESNTWHRRLGHINFKTMIKLVKGNLVKGLPLKIFENDHSCVACQKGKQHKTSYKTKLMNSISKPLHMIHMDLFGPTNVKSLMKKSYCLVVTDDFSRFSWVFFLATKDETSGILKTFIAEIENQLDHKVKVIRSDNGTEFKNSIMNQFYEMKGIKKEFSVAERKNRTLIEVARTMDLVIKPHNKTPYELIPGRPPLIDFMKPFRYPVTILNIRDHLGKFEGKADEEYFVGYSVVSKAMRVFNKRTRIVEETLNIKFLKNTTNVKGNGPDWLFDVDSLLISLNYVPVATENKTNGITGTKDNIVAGQAQKEKEPEQEYIQIPLCTTDPLISQGPKDCEGDARMKPTEVDENEASDKSGNHDQEARSESKRINQREMQTEHTNSSNGINTVSTPVSTAGPSFDTIVPSTLINTAGPSVSTSNESEEQLFERFSPFKNAFTHPPVLNISLMDNTGIFGNAYDDEDVEKEVDMNNVISSYTVPDTSFTKFHKDHPEDQVIGSLKTLVQTRHMTKITEEHGLFSSVHKLRRTNHKDFQNYLSSCFLSQMEPKKPVQALKHPIWVEAMQDELL